MRKGLQGGVQQGGHYLLRFQVPLRLANMTQVLTAAEARLLLGGKKPAPAARAERKPPAPPKEPSKPRERNTDELEAQSQRRKDNAQRRAEAELSRLNQQEAPRYQTGKGESTLGTVRFFHLQPAQQEQLIAYATTVLNAKPA